MIGILTERESGNLVPENKWMVAHAVVFWLKSFILAESIWYLQEHNFEHI